MSINNYSSVSQYVSRELPQLYASDASPSPIYNGIGRELPRPYALDFMAHFRGSQPLLSHIIDMTPVYTVNKDVPRLTQYIPRDLKRENPPADLVSRSETPERAVESAPVSPQVEEALPSLETPERAVESAPVSPQVEEAFPSLEIPQMGADFRVPSSPLSVIIPLPTLSPVKAFEVLESPLGA